MTKVTCVMKNEFEKMTNIKDSWENPELSNVKNNFIHGWEAALKQPLQMMPDGTVKPVFIDLIEEGQK